RRPRAPGPDAGRDRPGEQMSPIGVSAGAALEANRFGKGRTRGGTMMNPGAGLIRAFAVLALVAVLQGGAVQAAPHVVLIVVDDMGWMDLHCQGNDRLSTPRIDRLAKQGVRFTNAYAASPVCSPTRGALITGLAPARLRITQHGKDGPSFWPKDRRVQP